MHLQIVIDVVYQPATETKAANLALDMVSQYLNNGLPLAINNDHGLTAAWLERARAVALSRAAENFNPPTIVPAARLPATPPPGGNGPRR